MLGEGAVRLAGGLVGSLSASIFYLRSYVDNEGLTLALAPSITVTVSALGIASVLGLLASLWPAWIAAKEPLVESLR